MGTRPIEAQFYIAGSRIDLDEDDLHEFKAHRTISIEELPPWCIIEEEGKAKRSRQPISKTVCAFLNTARGGLILLGVKDDGTVTGLRMTQFQVRG